MSDFNIRFERKGGALHISLAGDFHAAAAQMFSDALKRDCDDEDTVFVDTSGLTKIHISSRDVLLKCLSDLKNKSTHVILKGRHKARLGSEEI